MLLRSGSWIVRRVGGALRSTATWVVPLGALAGAACGSQASPASTEAPGSDAGAEGAAAPDGAPLGQDATGPAETGGPALEGGSAPTVNPELVLLTYLGGAGDQYFQQAGFDASGNVFAKGDGFALTFDPHSLQAASSGNPAAAMDLKAFPVNFPLPKGGLSTNHYSDPRNGQTYTWGTHPNVAKGGTACPAQCKGMCTPGDPLAAFLQMAFVTSDKGWKLWDFGWDACVSACEVADSRGYDLWPAADGKVGVMLWTDGGDTPLRHDPTDVSKPPTFLQGAFGDSPGGRGVLFALIDPESGLVPSGTFLNTHAVFHAQDAWGRVYLPKSLPIRYGQSDHPQPTNPWGQATTAETGLFVLDNGFKQPEFHAYLGGSTATCASADSALQLVDAIALQGNLLVMAGTTCATDLATTPNAVQKTLGGGQDGFVAVIKLWD